MYVRARQEGGFEQRAQRYLDSSLGNNNVAGLLINIVVISAYKLLTHLGAWALLSLYIFNSSHEIITYIWELQQQCAKDWLHIR